MGGNQPRQAACGCAASQDRLGAIDYPSALRVAESLRQAVAALQVQANDDGGCVTLTVSVGIATQEDGALSFEQLMNHADKALYKAKQTGRNNVQGFDGATLAA